jgi:integrase
MEINNYTPPKINRGKEIKNPPKGSSIKKELLKNSWYISYTFNGKQIKVKGGINRFDTFEDRDYEANILLKSIIKDLEDGYNPISPKEYLSKIFKQNISLTKGIEIFKEYHIKHQSRLSTIQSYLSKLNHLSILYSNKQLNGITTKDLEDFIIQKIEANEYTNVSVKIAKKIFKTFFNVLIELGYYESESPMVGFNPKIKSFKIVEENHIPYLKEDAKRVMSYLKENDYYSFIFCNIIYETCLRPSEIKGLKVRDISFLNNTITVNPNVKKVTTEIKKDIIQLTPTLSQLFKKLDLENKPKNHYLMGSYVTITGQNRIGKNIPYNRLIKAFKAIDKQALKENPNLKESELLVNKGYDLYSWKHFSNINRFKNGWTPEQIMVLNRHSNIAQTLKYMRNLKNETDISSLKVPSIF